MKNPIFEKIYTRAIFTLEIELAHLERLPISINSHFCACVYHLFQLKGRIVVTGIGKSALIAQKVVATLNSTGTPALFLHAGDALHGDLGMIQKEDGILCLSQSGETIEIKRLIPHLQRHASLLVALVGNPSSSLAKAADFVIPTPIEREADPNNLAPTTSSLLQLALGDAIAMALQELRGFDSAQFAALHPGGSLGNILHLRIQDFPIKEQRPFVLPTASLKDVIIDISSNKLGVTAVLDERTALQGVITDGDLRRALEKHDDIRKLEAAMIMTSTPICITPDFMAVEALKLMQRNKITQLLVVEAEKYIGIVHIHQLLAAGLGNLN